MSTYFKEEQETILNFSNETKEWTVYSTIPKHIRLLMTLGEMNIVDKDDDRPTAIEGKLSEKQVSMKKVRIMSEEQRLMAAERMKQYHKNK